MTRRLASLPLAIGELAAIAALSAVGTVIEQNKGLEYYQATYSGAEGGLSTLLTWRVITALGWDHVYTSPPFLALCALLAASLTACTAVRQLPAARVARDWRFATTPSAVAARARGAKHLGAGAAAARLPAGRATDLGRVLAGKGYQVFVRSGLDEGGVVAGLSSSSSPTTPPSSSSSPSAALYAFKGMAGKLGPVAVHASLLLIIGGAAGGALLGARGNAMAPEGTAFVIGDAMAPASPVAPKPAGAGALLRVDGFRVDYRDDGSVAQFETTASVVDPTTGATTVDGAVISVNKPLRYKGVTAYQADYSMAALTVRVTADKSGGAGTSTSPLVAAAAAAGDPINLPMAELKDVAGVKGRAWAAFLPLEGAPPAAEPGAPPPPPPRGVTLLARDFQAIAAYGPDGAFAGVRRPGSGTPLTVSGVTIIVDAIVGAAGLELKADPGVPAVYAGFGGLMVSTLVSYLSHSQVWALQTRDGTLHVAGRTNRAALGFGAEFDAALAAVPEDPAVVDG